jgi:protoheme IX farnesyltransferase
VTYVGHRAPALSESDSSLATGAARYRDVIAAYVGLTKPRVIELLLLTTVPVMFFAARGIPDLGLVLATVVGGALSAGSASALNCVYDRDIDEQMRRTRRRWCSAWCSGCWRR